MEHGENGEFKWTHAKSLYRDWGAILTFLKLLTLVMAILSALLTVLCGFKDGFSLDLFTTLGGLFAIVILVIWALIVPSYCLWAWAQGGADEWEFEMDDRGIKGRKVVRKPWRMKLLRGIACVLMILPSRGNQKMAMRSIFYDSRKNKVDVLFSSVKEVACDEKKGLISLYTRGDSKEIHVPREHYAEVRAFIEERLPKKKPKRKRTGGRKKSAATDSKEPTDSKEKGSAE